MLKIGTVTDNQDPEGLRRIKVTSVDRGVSSSQWLVRVTGFDGDDLPLPNIGTSVIVAEVGGDSAEDVILGVLQTATTNQPDPDKPTGGDWWTLLRGIKFWVSNRFTVTVPNTAKPTIDIREDGTVTASNRLGSVTLLPTGYIVVTNLSGTFTMGANGWTINAGNVALNCNSLTWNGSRVAVVGGNDSGGDTTLS